MKIENQVTSLKLSQKLKELGFKQESLFYWWKVNGEYSLAIRLGDKIKSTVYEFQFTTFGHKSEEYFSAYTVAELGEILPITVHTTRFEQGYPWQSHLQEIDLSDLDSPLQYKHFEAADTEADARAKMLIYLIENKLLKKKDENNSDC